MSSVPPELRPAVGHAAVNGVTDRWIGAEVEERSHCVHLSRLGGDVDRRHAPPWLGPPNVPRRSTSAPSSTSALTAGTWPFMAAQVSGSAAVGFGVPSAPSRPGVRTPRRPLFAAHTSASSTTSWVVGRSPGGEPAVRAVERRCARRPACRPVRIMSTRPSPAATRRFPGYDRGGHRRRDGPRRRRRPGRPPSPRAETRCARPRPSIIRPSSGEFP